MDLKSVPDSAGYDGQFYAQIALDPSLRDPEFPRVLDAPSYRAQRIAAPAAAAILGRGDPWGTLQAFALINVACWLATAWLIRALAPGNDWIAFARWAGCMFGIGALDSVRQSLVDLPAITLVLVSVRLAQQAVLSSSVASALAILTKETSTLASIALHVPDLLRRESTKRSLWLVMITTLPAAAWYLYVRNQFPQHNANHGMGNFTWPLGGAFALLCDSTAQLVAGNFDSRYIFGIVGLIGAIVQSYVIWRRPVLADPWWRIAATYSLLLPFLSLWVWSGYWAAYRAILPLTFGFNLLLSPNRSFWPLWVIGNLTLLHGIWRFL